MNVNICIIIVSKYFGNAALKHMLTSHGNTIALFQNLFLFLVNFASSPTLETIDSLNHNTIITQNFSVPVTVFLFSNCIQH